MERPDHTETQPAAQEVCAHRWCHFGDQQPRRRCIDCNTLEPAPRQATPATPEDMKVYGGIAAGYFADTQQATPEPVQAEQAKWCKYVAGMVDCWVSAEWPHYNHMDEDRRVKAIAGIIERRLWALQKQAATPEPVGEPVEWQARANGSKYDDAWRKVAPTAAQPTVRQRVEYLRSLKRADGQPAYEFRALYDRPAPGVPEDVQRNAARWGEVLRQVGADRQCGGFRFALYNLHPIPGSNPMQGAVCQHFTQAVDAAAAQAKGAAPEDLAAAGVMLMGRRADHA